MMNSEDLKKRTKDFALHTIQSIESLPTSKSADILGRQLIRSSTSIGANYRAACKGRSKADFVSKITIVEEEADESQYWLELLIELKLGNTEVLEGLLKEARELTAIFTAAGKTAKGKK
jgi:four helix bundle protein